jgi:hypothetical protein
MTVEDGDKKTKLSGTFRSFTKDEKTQFEKKHEEIGAAAKEAQFLIKQINRASKKAELKEKQGDFDAQEISLNELYNLEDKLEELNTDFNQNDSETELMRERFELCLGGKDADKIMELAEEHGFGRVFAIIQESIVEEEQGKQKK